MENFSKRIKYFFFCMLELLILIQKILKIKTFLEKLKKLKTQSKK